MKLPVRRFMRSRLFQDGAIVALLVSVSANRGLQLLLGHEVSLVITAVLLTIVWELRRLSLPSKRFVFVFLAFAAILLVQSIGFSYFPAVTIAGFLLKVFIAYASTRLVPSFPRVFVQVMYWTGIVSLVFHVPYQLCVALGLGLPVFGSLGPPLGQETTVHILVHSFVRSPEHAYRNAAYFWEPGAFAGFLLLALCLLALERTHLEHGAYRRRLALFVICIITTFSTTGYVLLPFCLLLHLPQRRPDRPLAAHYLLVFLLLASVVTIELASFRLEFVGDKMKTQYDNALAGRRGWESTRFGTLLFDWEYIKKRPFLGWGLHSRTRFMLHPYWELTAGQGNGLSDFIAKFGFVGFAVFLLCVSRSLLVLSDDWLRSAYILLLIVLTLNGEGYLNGPAFLSLMFLGPPTRRDHASGPHLKSKTSAVPARNAGPSSVLPRRRSRRRIDVSWSRSPA